MTNNLFTTTRHLENSKAKVEIINNEKEVENVKIIQLKTVIGVAIQKCSDLLLVQSNLYQLNKECCLVKQIEGEPPVINLDDNYYKKVGDYLNRFKEGVPDIRNLIELNVCSDVYFGKNVKLEGKVNIQAKQRNQLANGTELHD
ncbi:hypothetical protein ABK040_013103 [Willaertia magna]